MIRFLFLALSFSQITHAQTFNYLKADSIQISQILPPPFSTSSTEGKADLAQVLQVQSTRTELNCARARTEISRSLKSFYGAPFGPLTPEEILAADDLMVKVLVDVQYLGDNAKTVYNRPRPFVADPQEVHPCSEFVKPVSGSYPSGHSLEAHIMASVLDLIYPERKALFEARSMQIANDRVLAGVHYPSDLEAGRKLAEAMMTVLERSPAFEADLAKHLSQTAPAK